MKKKLFWKLCATIAVGTVALIWVVDWLTTQTETTMSHLSIEHQQQLNNYGKEAERVYLEEGEAALATWLSTFQKKEKTWAAIVTSNIKPLADSKIPQTYIDEFRIGRSVEWKIHLYFDYNPIMEVPFLDSKSHFLIQLPQRMRPGTYLTYIDILLQIALPFVILCAVSFVLYRHVMTPLKKLETATTAFSKGKFDVRVSDSLSNRNDELYTLAVHFDGMAERIGKLIYNQRELLSDLSHELRTPLTRVDMAIDMLENDIDNKNTLARLRYESQNMRALVEDALTLAWLNNESPALNNESFDLSELIQVICDDAAFEYPDRTINLTLPECAPIEQSSQQALGQAIENIIRNALKYTPEHSRIEVNLVCHATHYALSVLDFGHGVPESMLGDIFKPFFRVDKSHGTHVIGQKRGGFGLGLALAQRQVTAVGGKISARNHAQGELTGLEIDIVLPR
ncbi:two-component sensor histidine kinase [Alteromonas sp. KC3]|uniref:sensor histidine kinase n=1 Tax=unclassified Alteromonas TaxID=2614992 RepID=UPI001924AB2E|nr:MULTISPECIES: sensor histidine kinase [unclassified Alteromonas]BCO19115.1 two-component sensor histidine kinase [Alteromonas sp. KC3]BCO23074.1 two-component sensor histidine kinase [Alteromonas sp. KC14]